MCGAVTYSPAFAVPSARRGLTSLFGMGRGGTPVLSPPYFFRFRDVRRVVALVPPVRMPVWVKKGVLTGSSSHRRSRTFHSCLDLCLCVCQVRCSVKLLFFFVLAILSPERVWVISIARLRTLPPVHLQPIDVVVFDDPYMEILS